FTTILGTGIETAETLDNNFSVYPTLNNTTSSFQISLSSSVPSSTKIQFIGIDGRVVKNKSVAIIPGENTWNISASGLSPGLYFVRIVAGDKVYQQKVVVE